MDLRSCRQAADLRNMLAINPSWIDWAIVAPFLKVAEASHLSGESL